MADLTPSRIHSEGCDEYEEGPQVVAARDSHIDQMVACHMAAFPGEFLTLLGYRILYAFYCFCIRYHGGICLTAVMTGGRVVGVVAGGDPGLRSTFLRKYFLRLMWAAAGGAVLHRRVRERLVQHIGAKLWGLGRRLRGKLCRDRAIEPVLPLGTWSNLLSIGVHPSARGQGLGRTLIEGFCAESKRRGFKIVRLSVHSDNAAAIALYHKTGWKPVLVTRRGTFFIRSVEATA